VLPLRVVSLHQIIRNQVRQHFQRLGLGEDLADLAHRHAAFDPSTMLRTRSISVIEYSRCPLSVRVG
jgi:predicted N-formylglutamate amidohydrolase